MNVLVTGATTGLGKCVRRALMSSQHDVVGTGSPGEVDCLHYHASPHDLKAEGELAQAVLKIYGSHNLHAVVFNAGVNDIRPFHEVTPDFLQQLMWVNAQAPVMLLQQLVPCLARGARALFVVSDASHRPMRHSLAYNMSKAALAIAVKQLARELTRTEDLSIVGVNPGKLCGTPMSYYIDHRVCEVRGWTPEQASEYQRAGTVTGLETDPVLLGRFIANLLESPAFPAMSGAVLDLVG